jgi:hypothetical protein
MNTSVEATGHNLSDPTGERYSERKAEQAAEEASFFKRQELRQITSAAVEMRHHLGAVRHAAENAIEAMERGERPSGYSFGPIGHQLPFDIALAQQKLEMLFNQAMMMTISAEEIAAAYAQGTKGRG